MGVLLNFGRPFDGEPRQGSRNLLSSGAVYEALQGVQPELTLDGTPTEGSENPVTSGGVYAAISELQPSITMDDAPAEGSDNPVTSDGLYKLIAQLTQALEALTARVEELEAKMSVQASVEDGYAVLAGSGITVEDGYAAVEGATVDEDGYVVF